MEISKTFAVMQTCLRQDLNRKSAQFIHIFRVGGYLVSRSYLLKLVSLITVALALVLTSSCRSTDKSKSKSSVKSEKTVSKSVKDGDTAEAQADCTKKPELTLCCKAMTPKCNECREKNKRTLDTWQKTCLNDNDSLVDCSKKLPIVGCCSDDSEACVKCRAKAIRDLLAHKEKCGNYEAHSCDKKPPLSVCCQAMIPSCNSCRERNRRILEEWRGRCE